MKKVLILTSILVLTSIMLCSCGNTCEHCGNSTLAYNLVGDETDGIHVCDDCIQKMTMSKLSFNFTCADCNEEKVVKKNKVVIDGEEQIVCNTCLGNYPVIKAQ